MALYRTPVLRSVGSRISMTTREAMMWGYGVGQDFRPENMGSDWEFVDGTQAPRTAVQVHVEKNLRVYMESIIDACATVEEMAERNQLPVRPGTDMIRKFDPEVPLYLPIDDVVLDSSSTVEQKYEVYGEAAPYYSEETVNTEKEPNRYTAGDGSPLEAEGPTSLKNSKTKKGRRRKVVTIKQHYRSTQPMAGNKVGPYSLRDVSSFDTGHGTAS
eukprot:TRINITY_DN35181_c0_g1_i1.p1 TRINITY_DN35181_c0_g1~~TRINITY_DN35181_c0_g1_i1.p1  ORF type:complete len:229 (+),score=37.16 TRINITY_DN35181_c0_g1_i1:44-688(+)